MVAEEKCSRPDTDSNVITLVLKKEAIRWDTRGTIVNLLGVRICCHKLASSILPRRRAGLQQASPLYLRLLTIQVVHPN